MQEKQNVRWCVKETALETTNNKCSCSVYQSIWQWCINCPSEYFPENVPPVLSSKEISARIVIVRCSSKETASRTTDNEWWKEKNCSRTKEFHSEDFFRSEVLVWFYFSSFVRWFTSSAQNQQSSCEILFDAKLCPVLLDMCTQSFILLMHHYKPTSRATFQKRLFWKKLWLGIQIILLF